jgi:hypothetical protein
MRKLARVVGGFCVVLAAVLVLIGLTTLPSGGLMFALPYVFFMPAVVFGVVGWLLWRWGRPTPDKGDQ